MISVSSERECPLAPGSRLDAPPPGRLRRDMGRITARSGEQPQRELGDALHPVTITVVSPPSPVLCIAALRVYGIADCASSPIDRIAAVRLQCVSFAPA
jgi:hypothetical protein